MAIGEDQKAFVKAKVKELGSVKAVEELYKTDSPIDKMARALAHRMYEKPKAK